MVHSCHPSSQESGAGGLQVQSQPQIHSESQASLGYLKVCLNKQIRINKSNAQHSLYRRFQNLGGWDRRIWSLGQPGLHSTALLPINKGEGREGLKCWTGNAWEYVCVWETGGNGIELSGQTLSLTLLQSQTATLSPGRGHLPPDRPLAQSKDKSSCCLPHISESHS